MSINFRKAVFVKTVMDKAGLPKLKLPEIAVVGRSNVGKSSLLNHLFQNKKLVKTSSTPGKTQAINFFLVDEKVFFVDLPGYGFAKVPKEIRKSWGALIEEYLQEREPLCLVLFLLDIRREPSEEDFQFISWLRAQGKAVILVFTKSDKLAQSKQKNAAKAILDEMGLQEISYVCYSTTKNQGSRELYSAIEHYLP